MKSGRGFHFVGAKVIEGRKAWHKELRRALRNSVLRTRIDKKHIMISMMRGYSTLRITASDVKPAIPLLIPLKVVSDSDLIPVAGSDVKPVVFGAKRRWRSYGA